MGQCWAKHRKGKERRPAHERYQPRQSESQQPIVNGVQTNDISAAVSSVSLDRSGTQHISERENADLDVNEHPADCATGKSLVLESSQVDLKQRRKSHYDNHFLVDTSPVSQLKRSNSCSTIYLHETVSQPNMKNTIKAVSLGIYNLIRNRKGKSFYQLSSAPYGLDDSDQQMLANLEIFDEKAHPLTADRVPSDYASRNPEHKTVYRFIRTLFSQAQLNAECAIVTLVYLERLLTYADFELTPANWKRVTLGAIMLASKVWDDQAVWNVDFCSIFKDVSVEDMNALERQFLQILQFNTNVGPSVYAKYYFDLRALADANDLSLNIEPLSKEKAVKLEAMSSPYKDRFDSGCKVKRSASVDGTSTLNRSSLAIIS